MRNGGGPACLRLRASMTLRQWQGIPESIRFTPETCLRLEAWVHRHYRDRLVPSDLRDTQFAVEVGKAFAELRTLLAMDTAESE
jgi:succinylarginine dihydrolase